MNQMEAQFTEYMWQIALRFPIFLIAVGGIGWAIMNWKTAPKPALYATIGCGVLFLLSCMFPAMMVWIPNLIARNAPMQDAFTRLRWTQRGITVMWNLCSALSIGALIFAVFAERVAARAERERKAKRVEDDDD